jgi:hypothetical protein
MKYILIYLALFILFFPPVILGCFTWIWKPTKQGFFRGSRWLDMKFNYGNIIEKLVEESKN